MQLKYLLTVLAVVSILAQEAKSECTLPAVYTRKAYEKILFAITHNGHMQLLLNDRVPVGATLHASCGGAITHNIICEQNNRFNGELPQNDCAGYTKTTVRQIADPACNFQSYSIGYVVDGNLLELIRSCYNQEQLRLVYAVHKVKPFAANTAARAPTCGWKADEISQDLTKIYQKSQVAFFERLIGDGATRMAKLNDLKIVINRGHMAPKQDFMFYYHKCTTFRYTNSAPQFATVNGGNWQGVEQLVQQLPNVERIITGTQDVLELDNPVYLITQPTQQLPIPKWIYKIFITSTSDVYVLLSYNNIFNDNRPARPICDVISCPTQFNPNDLTSAIQGFIYCCNPTTFKNYVPDLQNVY